jgi:hypothetical protein
MRITSKLISKEDDVRVELEWCTVSLWSCPRSWLLYCTDSLHLPGYPATARGRDKTNIIQLSRVQRWGIPEQVINLSSSANGEELFEGHLFKVISQWSSLSESYRSSVWVTVFFLYTCHFSEHFLRMYLMLKLSQHQHSVAAVLCLYKEGRLPTAVVLFALCLLCIRDV